MENPGPDASAAEQMRYLEETFWDSFSEGVEEASQEDEDETDGIEKGEQEPDEE
jgi:hypothetical protein